MAYVKITFKNGELIAEHKKTGPELIKGLMFKEKGNALLEFKKETKAKIWMLFMRYDLILYFISEDLKVIDKKFAKKLSLSPKTWKLYSSNTPYKYVLEVDSREKPRIEIGEKIKICFIPQEEMEKYA